MTGSIMVVDDDAGLRFTLQTLLEDEGFSVVLAGDGQEALAKLTDPLPSLMLLDIMMPRMDGFALAREMEERGLRPSVPIVVLTADGKAAQNARRMGAEGFVAKPFAVDDILSEIQRLATR